MTGAEVARSRLALRISPLSCPNLYTVPPKEVQYNSLPAATGADFTSLSIQRCHRMLPVFSSRQASTCEAGGALAPRPAAGYDVKTLPPAIVGVLVSGSPRKYDQRCLPVAASSAKIVH